MKLKDLGKDAEELAYLFGALRDGSIDIRKGKNYEIKIAQNSLEWLKLIKRIIDKNFNTTSNINNGLVRVTREKVVLEIIKLSDMKVPQINWNTPKIIKDSNLDRIIISYIQGFWDSEGGLPKHPEKTKNAAERYISFHQKNKEPLVFIRSKLLDFGFNPTKITFCGNVFEFRICRKREIFKFYKLIGTRHPEKKKRLKKLINVFSF